MDEPINLFASSEGLDVAKPVDAVNLFAPDPNAPGPFRKGLGAGIAGVKSSLYGAGALLAHGATAVLPDAVTPITQNLEAAALENVKTQNDLAASQSMSFEDVLADPTRSAEYFKFLLGQAVPSLATMAVGGGLGALAGRAIAGQAGLAAARAAGVVAPAVRAGAFAGAVAPDVAMEAGSIYPEALDQKVENPALRAVAGGAGAAALDFVPLLAAEKYLKPVGKGGLGALATGAVKGAPVGATLEGSQEMLQSLVERAAAGKSLTDPEAVSDYINSFLGGAAPGTVFGAAIGARRQSAAPVQETPPSTNPEQPPAVNGPNLGANDPNLGTPLPTSSPAEMGDYWGAQYLAATDQLAALEPQVTQAQAAHDEAAARLGALTEELKLPVGERRTKSEILTERKELNKMVNALKTQLESLGGQLHSTRATIADITPRLEATARSVVDEQNLGTSEQLPGVPNTVVPAEGLNPAIAPKTDPLVSSTIADPNVAPVPESEQIKRAVTGVQSLMRERGMMPTINDTIAAAGKSLTEPMGFTPVESTPRDVALAKVEQRGKTVSTDTTAQMAAVEDHAMTVIEPLAMTLAKTKTDTPGGQAKIAKAMTAAMRGVVQEAAKQPSVEAAQQYITDKLPNALKGHGVAVDAADMAKAVSAAVGQAKTQYSKGATSVTEDQMKRTREAQRDGVGLDVVPEDMFKHKTNPGVEHGGEFQYMAEHIGDLVHRLSHGETTGGGPQYGMDAAASKVARFTKLSRYADVVPQVERNYEYAVESQGYKGTKEQYLAEFKAAAQRYADAYKKVPVHTEMQRLGRDAAIALGELRFSDAHQSLLQLEKMLDSKDATGLYWSPLQQSHAALTQDEFDTLPEPAKFAAVDEFNRVMRERGTKLRLDLAKLIGNRPELVVKTFMATPGSPIGSYTRVGPHKAVITLALNAQSELGVLSHEGFHYAEDWLLTAAEKRVVANGMKPGRPLFSQLVSKLQAYDQENKTNLTDEVTGVPAEARAYGFEFWRRGELQADGPIARVWQKIAQFLERVANLVKGNGFTSIEDVFTALDRGQFVERQANSGQISELAGEFQTQSSKSADYLQSPEFKKWFGDSKVVDAEGRPLVVKHGTSKDFGIFDSAHETKGSFHPTATAGFFFSADGGVASGFSGEKWDETTWPRTVGFKEGANVMPVYLAIANPKVITAREFVDRFVRARFYKDGKESFKSWARAGGHDGVLIKGDAALAERLSGDEYKADTWVAFRPEQIKSAIGNTGAFDPNNPDIRFSTAAAQSAYPKYQPPLSEEFKRELAKDPEAARQFAEWRKANEYWQAVQEGQGARTQFSKGAIAPNDFRSAFAEMTTRFQNGELEREQYFLAVTKLMDQAQTHIPTVRNLATAIGEESVGAFTRARTYLATGNYIGKFSKGYKNVLKALSAQEQYKDRLIADGSEVGLSKWHTATQEDREVTFNALLKRRIGGFLKGSPEFNALMEPLTDSQKAMFAQVSGDKDNEGVIAKFLHLEFGAETEAFRRIMTVPEFEQWQAERAASVQGLIDNGYVPERRYGDHTVKIIVDVTDANGRVTPTVVAREQFETAAGARVRAEQYMAEAKAAGSNVRVEQGIQHSVERDSDLSLQQVLDLTRRQGIRLGQVEIEKLSRALLAADSMRRNRMMRSDNVPGYSRAGWRVLNEWVTGMSGRVAHSVFSSTVNDALDGKPVEAYVDENGKPIVSTDTTRNLWVDDGPKSGFYRDLADKRADLVLRPQDSSILSTKLKASAMTYFIGGSLGAGMVQMFSVPMNTLPYLSQHTSYADAFSTTLAAWGYTLKNAGVLRDLNRLKDPDVRIEGLTPELRQALITAAQDGTNSSTEIHQIMGISRGGLLSQSRTVQRAMEVWMAPFKFGENTSRVASFIAAWNLATTGEGVALRQADGTYAAPRKLGGRELYNFAKNAVDETQNRFDPVNRPTVASHPIGSLLFMFKSFPLFVVEMIETMFRQNPKSAVYMLLGLVALTGVQGLPFAEDILDIVDVISQKLFNSPFNSRRAMRNMFKDASEALVGVDLSNLFMRGMVNDLIGLNVATRVGNGDMLPGTRIGAADADYGRTLEQILGAPFSMVVGVGSALPKLVGGITKGDMEQVMAALRAGGPVAVRNAIKGYEQLDTGFAQDARGRRLSKDPVTGVEAFWQSIGVSSGTLTKLYDLDAMDRQTTAFYKQVSADMQQRLVAAMRDGNQAKAQEVYDAMRAWDEANPERPLRVSPASMRRSIMLAGMPLNQRTMLLMPRQLRGTSVASENVGQ